MRVALVSDIHGNLTALEAVIADIDRRAPDAVVHGGDLVLMGAEPAEVVDRVRELGWPGVVGNTDELLWRPEERARQERRAPRLIALLRLLFDEYAPATRELLGEDRLAWLRGLPTEERLEDLLVLHAAPDDLWRAPMPDATDAELTSVYGECEAAEIAYGHIHRPYVRTPGQLTVANCGSVGMPWDADPRASYLLVEDGQPRVIRIPYDVEREARTLAASGYPDSRRLAEMRRQGRFLAPGWSPP
jgi:predicted phosphodiesterase